MANETLDLAQILANYSPEQIAEFVADYNRQNESVAEANKVLEAKLYPADERDVTMDEARDKFFEFAEFVNTAIVLTPGDPNGSQARSRADKRTIEIPTPLGSLQVRLMLDN